jgi:hypothetical protein
MPQTLSAVASICIFLIIFMVVPRGNFIYISTVTPIVTGVT